MTYRRVLTADQVAWVLAIHRKQRQHRRAVKRADTAAAREEAMRQLRLLPTVRELAAALDVHIRTINRIRSGHEYVAAAPNNVPRGTPNHSGVTPC